MAVLGGKLGRMVEDITTLEVNTIICDGMTGEEMSDPRQALFDVGAEYIDVLRRLVPGFQPPPESAPGPDQVCGSRAVFAALHVAARDADPDHLAGLSTHERTLVTRVRVKSGHLVALFDRLRSATSDPADHIDNTLCRRAINGSDGFTRPPPLPLTYDERMLLRKIWELSTETIAMQTVINLSGDVVSRLQRDYIGEQHAVLHKIHGEGIRIALTSWGAMIQAIGDLLGALRR